MRITPNIPLPLTREIRAAQAQVRTFLQYARRLQTRLRGEGMGVESLRGELDAANATLRASAQTAWSLVRDPLVAETVALIRAAAQRALVDFFASPARIPSFTTDAEQVVPALFTRTFSANPALLHTEAERLIDELDRLVAGIFTVTIDSAECATHEAVPVPAAA